MWYSGISLKEKVMTKSDLKRQLRTGPDRANHFGNDTIKIVETTYKILASGKRVIDKIKISKLEKF